MNKNILTRKKIISNVIEDGVHEGVIESTEVKTINSKFGEREAAIFGLIVSSQDGEQRRIEFSPTITWYENSKFVRTLDNLGLLGNDENEDINLSKVNGLPVLIEVKNNQTEDGRRYSNVISIKRDPDRHFEPKDNKDAIKKAEELFQD